MLRKTIFMASIITLLATAAGTFAASSVSAAGYGYGNSGYSQNTARTYGGQNTYRGGNPHLRWCYNNYRSYREADNTFQPYEGPRKPCLSPHDGARLALFPEAPAIPGERDQFGNLPEAPAQAAPAAPAAPAPDGARDEFGNLPEAGSAAAGNAPETAEPPVISAPPVPAPAPAGQAENVAPDDTGTSLREALGLPSEAAPEGGEAGTGESPAGGLAGGDES